MDYNVNKTHRKIKTEYEKLILHAKRPKLAFSFISPQKRFVKNRLYSNKPSLCTVTNQRTDSLIKTRKLCYLIRLTEAHQFHFVFK